MGTNYGGFVSYMSYIMSFMTEIFKYLFDLTSGGLNWTSSPTHTYSLYSASGDQWALSGNLPKLTAKGEDIISAIMTIVHNGLIAVAQISTLLPANALGSFHGS